MRPPGTTGLALMALAVVVVGASAEVLDDSPVSLVELSEEETRSTSGEIKEAQELVAAERKQMDKRSGAAAKAQTGGNSQNLGEAAGKKEEAPPNLKLGKMPQMPQLVRGKEGKPPRREKEKKVRRNRERNPFSSIKKGSLSGQASRRRWWARRRAKYIRRRRMDYDRRRRAVLRRRRGFSALP